MIGVRKTGLGEGGMMANSTQPIHGALVSTFPSLSGWDSTRTTSATVETLRKTSTLEEMISCMGMERSDSMRRRDRLSD